MTKEEAFEKLRHTLCLNNIKGELKFGISEIDCKDNQEMVDCLDIINDVINPMPKLYNYFVTYNCVDKLGNCNLVRGTEIKNIDDIRDIEKQISTELCDGQTVIITSWRLYD